MNRVALRAFATLAVWPLASLAQVAVTDAGHYQFVHVDTTLEGSDDVSRGWSSLGDYTASIAAALGDPIAAQGSASETSTTLADGSEITGLLSADSYVSITDANQGFNYSTSVHSIDFTTATDLEVVVDFSLLIHDDVGAEGYFDLQIYDIDRQALVYYEDHWGEVDLTARRVIPLVPSRYRMSFTVSAESHNDLTNGVYAAQAEASYSVAFVPTPGSVFVLVTAAGCTRRRR